MKLFNITSMKVILILAVLLCYFESFGQSQTSLKVEGGCGMCKATIEEVASEFSQLRQIKYDLNAKLLTFKVEAEGFELEELAMALSNAGYANAIFPANEEAYNDLPLCCQYRDAQGDAEGSMSHNDTAPALSQFVNGLVVTAEGFEPLIGATVRWSHAQTGTATDVDGRFEIGRIKGAKQLIISYIGFDNDTIDVSAVNEIHHVMNSTTILDEVVISHRSKTTSISFVDPIQTLVVTEQELCKAACCSLSESFETSPSIDVSFTDAVTGTRQIQMLGLDGKYVQISRELIPDVRSLSAIHGLESTPGPWIESIQLSKGVGSVVNGFESMTGQINVELRKPEKEEKLFLNLYGNQGGRFEGNLNYNVDLTKRLSTGFLVHGSSRQLRIDHNQDRFLDMPLMQNFVGINRWKYQNKNGLQAQIGIKYNQSYKVAGQVDFVPEDIDWKSGIWGSQNELKKLDLWSKVGKVLNEVKNRSIGLQVAYVSHSHAATYGLKNYSVDHAMYYANLIFQTELVSSAHQLTTGLSFLSDDILEFGVINPIQGIDQEDLPYEFESKRDERIPGIFGEYTFKPSSQWTAVLGLRADQHNNYGFQLTPRFHLRYAPTDNTTLRFVTGSGWRTPNIFSENPRIWASNRNISFKDGVTPYGLGLEKSWNIGVNLTQQLELGQREGILSLDYYWTQFENQVIADYEGRFEVGTSLPISFLNQNGESYGHSAQAQIDIEVIKNFDMRLAYRYNISFAQLGGQFVETPYNPFHKAFVNLAYEVTDDWYFDTTLSWRSKQRLPALIEVDGLNYNLYSEDFFLLNAQIRKFLAPEFECYLGVENLLNYVQQSPIINADNPFGSAFDASVIWAPIFGRNIYLGLRYRLPK